MNKPFKGLRPRANFLNPLLSGWILFWSVILLSAGCTKNNGSREEEEEDPDPSEYYVRFEVDGVKMNFTYDAVIQIFPKSNKDIYAASAAGFLNFLDKEKNFLGITIWSDQQLDVATYRNNAFVLDQEGAKLAQTHIIYKDDNANAYISLATPVTSLPPFDKVVSDLVVDITSFTDKRVAGKFSGTLYKSGDTELNTTILVTNGEFSLKPQKN